MRDLHLQHFVIVPLLFLLAAATACRSAPDTAVATVAPNEAPITLVATITRPSATDSPVASPARLTSTPKPAASPTSNDQPTEPATTQPTPTKTPAPDSAASSYDISFTKVADGFKSPVYVTDAGDDTGRLFVVEQGGTIRIIENRKVLDTPFLDISNLVDTDGTERGLLSVAFHPDYKNNGLFFVDYTGEPNGDTVIARYHVSDDPNVADAQSGETKLTIEQPEPNHNGGQLQFGPDGYLYVGIGDGGGQGDRHGSIGNGQNLGALLGKILRIDINKDPYAIPQDNPFVNQGGARPEIWAYGLRNPWRFSFDRATGDLYIADVGQSSYEEVNFQPASSHGGENYGWRIMEGKHCYNPSSGCDQSGITLPFTEYSHDVGGCSITGGYVYRGAMYPWLNGVYFFTDYCTGILWSAARDASGNWQVEKRLTEAISPSSFGEDQAGELYLVGHGDGAIYKLSSTQK